MSCCYSAFELLLHGTWTYACYQRVDVLSQLLDSYSLRLSYCLVRGHVLPTTARGRSLAATRPATLRLTYCLVRPSSCYQRVDVLSQLLDSSLHVGSRNYQSFPTRRARTENKRSQSSFQRVQQSCHARSSRFLGQRLCDSMHV